MPNYDEQFLLKRANSFFERGRLPKALVCYKLLHRVASPALREELCTQMAKTCALLENFEEAISHYHESMDLVDPIKLPDIYVQVAHLYHEMGQLDEAVQWYRRVLSESPKFPGDIFYWIAELLNDNRNKRRVEESLECLDKAINQARQLVLDWEIHNTKGFLLMLQGNTLKALREFEIALSKSKFDNIDIPGNVYNNMATCLTSLQRYDEAIDWFRKSIDHPRSLADTRGYAHYFIGVLGLFSQSTDAEGEFQKAKWEFEQSAKKGEVPSWYGASYIRHIRKWSHKLKDFTVSKKIEHRIRISLVGGIVVPELESAKSIHTTLKLFISYATDDRIAVKKLVTRLRGDGFDPWFDQDKLLPGEDWDLEIKKALSASAVILVCMSKHSVTKEGYVQKEIKVALDIADEKPEGTIFIIPVRFEECEVPNKLKKWQWMDYESEDGYERLKAALQLRAQELSDRQINQ